MKQPMYYVAEYGEYFELQLNTSTKPYLMRDRNKQKIIEYYNTHKQMCGYRDANIIDLTCHD